MIYVDTSVIVKLYVKEKHSLNASNWLKENNEAIPITTFHELEFNNAIKLKALQAEIMPQRILAPKIGQRPKGPFWPVHHGFSLPPSKLFLSQFHTFIFYLF